MHGPTCIFWANLTPLLAGAVRQGPRGQRYRGGVLLPKAEGTRSAPPSWDPGRPSTAGGALSQRGRHRGVGKMAVVVKQHARSQLLQPAESGYRLPLSHTSATAAVGHGSRWPRQPLAASRWPLETAAAHSNSMRLDAGPPAPPPPPYAIYLWLLPRCARPYPMPLSGT